MLKWVENLTPQPPNGMVPLPMGEALDSHSSLYYFSDTKAVHSDLAVRLVGDESLFWALVDRKCLRLVGPVERGGYDVYLGPRAIRDEIQERARKGQMA